MKKLVIIPAYNEKDSIVNTVKDIKDNAQGFDYIVVNDCSTDNTYDVCVENGLKVINLPLNLGIGFLTLRILLNLRVQILSY